MAGFQRIFQHVFHFAPVTSTVWVQMQMISAAPCPSKLPQQQNSPGNLLSEKPGSHMLVLTSMCFNPKKELKSGNAGPAQEALAVGGFTTAELHHKKRKKPYGTTSSCCILKIQYIINEYVLKASKLNSENWRS